VQNYQYSINHRNDNCMKAADTWFSTVLKESFISA
jgi:hypothetical protein